jgi:hypothetical protein
MAGLGRPRGQLTTLCCAEQLEGRYPLSVNISDIPLNKTFNSVYLDKHISRSDMIALFRSAQDHGSVDVSEVSSLRSIINHSQMPDYVKYFANNIITSIAPTDLRNIQTVSSSKSLQLLIDKWFLGLDRPTIQSWQHRASYQYIQGALFVNGPNIEDIKQGSLADCYLLNALGAIAYSSPKNIENMFIYNGDNTWTIRFFSHTDQKNHYVTVDRFLPTRTNGKSLFADFGNAFRPQNNELWVALAEKGYVQFSSNNTSIRNKVWNDYANISGGLTRLATYHILQIHPSKSTLSDQQRTIDLLKRGPLTISINNHAYTITSFNQQTQRFYIRNPWGFRHMDLTWQEIKTNNLHNKTIYLVQAKLGK